MLPRGLRFPARLSLPFAIVCVLALSAKATTQAEDDVNKAPMPHQSLGSHGALVKVHLVSLRGYMEGSPNDATRLAKLQAEVQACVQRNQARGLPSRPPHALPDHVISERMDTYSSINRTIHYVSGLAYTVNPLDCSLLETMRSTADLFSRSGTCKIDLREKTAHGACDGGAQASARPPTRPPAPSGAQMAAFERRAATDPAAAALVAAMRNHPQAGTGVRKSILGLECDVWPNPLDPDGSVCISRGGSFVAAHAAGGLTQSSMELEMDSKAGVKMVATEAKLDVMVNGAVFAPYLAGGFHITNTGAHP
ncbi:hypothetical protein CSQ96_27655 [Janthinobacterium sp. BJB412]|nr:hypothetical protein CSQ96_27655 [Janthinobacterium sp. BJB412]